MFPDKGLVFVKIREKDPGIEALISQAPGHVMKHDACDFMSPRGKIPGRYDQHMHAFGLGLKVKR